MGIPKKYCFLFCCSMVGFLMGIDPEQKSSESEDILSDGEFEIISDVKSSQADVPLESLFESDEMTRDFFGEADEETIVRSAPESKGALRSAVEPYALYLVVWYEKCNKAFFAALASIKRALHIAHD